MSAQPTNIFQKHTTGLILLIMFVGACLRLYQMDRSLGGGDENHMLLYFGYTHLQYIATTYFDASNHIFHTMLVNLMSRWFGEENAMAIRLPTFLFGIACLLMIYKVAWEIFASKEIALMALLIAAVNPVHIYYSQIARGYSLMIFFSTAVIYILIKLLQLKPNPWHVLFLTLCGFLSVYTLPTNIFLLISLAGWLLIILFTPSLSREHGINGEGRKQKVIWFAGSTLVMGFLLLLSYLPVLDQMVATARNHSLLTFNTQSVSISNLAPAIVRRIFQDPLIWFSPFLMVGLIYGKVEQRSYRLLPVFIFFLPLIITAITGVGGFPRNYLFNFPLLTIFFAAGLSVVGGHVGKWFRFDGRIISVAGLLVLIYSLSSLYVVFFEHYPSIRIPDGNLYKEKVRQNNGPNDLLVVNSAENYLYARSTYKTSILNIIKENKLSGVNFIKKSSFNTIETELSDNNGIWKLLNNIFKKDDLLFQDVSGGKEIAALSKNKAFSILPGELGSNMQWKIVDGSGELSIVEDQGLVGNKILSLTAHPKESMVAKALVPGEYTLTRPGFVVVILATKNFNPSLMVYHPLLTASFNVTGGRQKVKLLTRKVNDGINLQVEGKSDGQDRYYWRVNSFIGILPPGVYNFELFLKCHESNSVLYDGLRMFLIEAV
jgi:4-amino-4-deoxy-L-arabinose transferase-like glycosyltransferase